MNVYRKARNVAHIDQKGFSLPELVVVIGIFAIISTVAMFNQAKLSSSVLLTNMAYEVGLAVREAQIYSLGTRGEDAGINFAGQYGAYFSTDSPTSKRQVIVFADGSIPGTPANFTYDAGEEKYIYEFENSRGNMISAICVGALSGTACQNGLNSESPVAVLFKSPNPSAFISPKTTGENPRLSRVYIVVSSFDGDDCRVVVVEPTGQIRVEDSSKGACTKIAP